MKSLSWTSIRAQHYLKWMQLLATWELMHRWRERRYCLQSGQSCPTRCICPLAVHRVLMVQERRYCQRKGKALSIPDFHTESLTKRNWQLSRAFCDATDSAARDNFSLPAQALLFPGHWRAGHASQQVTFYPKMCFHESSKMFYLLSSRLPMWNWKTFSQ